MSGELQSYLVISTLLFSLGLCGLLARRHVIAMLISLELILGAANLNFVALGRFAMPDPSTGQIFALLLTRRYGSVHMDDAKDLKE